MQIPNNANSRDAIVTLSGLSEARGMTTEYTGADRRWHDMTAVNPMD